MYSELNELLSRGTITPGWFESYLQSYERACLKYSPGLWWVKLPNHVDMPNEASFAQIPLLGLLFAKRMSIICGYVQEEGHAHPRLDCRIYVTGIETPVYSFYEKIEKQPTTDQDIRELGKKVIQNAARCITYLAGKAGHRRATGDADSRVVVINGGAS